MCCQLRQLAARVESAREEERAGISREVDDQFGQMLSPLKLDFETLASRYRPRWAEARGEFDQRVAAIVREIDLSVKTVRRIAAEDLRRPSTRRCHAVVRSREPVPEGVDDALEALPDGRWARTPAGERAHVGQQTRTAKAARTAGLRRGRTPEN